MLPSLPDTLNSPKWPPRCNHRLKPPARPAAWPGSPVAGGTSEAAEPGAKVMVGTPSSPSVLENLEIPGKKEIVGNWKYRSCL